MFKITATLILIVFVANALSRKRINKKFGKVAKAAKEDKVDEAENSRKVLENPDLMEGDILPPGDVLSRNAIANSYNLWPDGVIPVQVDSKYPHNVDLINAAMEHIEQRTCIKFKAHTNEQNYVHIFSGEGCYSHVGRIGGAQRLSLHAGCQNFGTVLHELLHAIGFYHAHNRSDRDKYLRIHWSNILQPQRHNFRQLSSSENKLFFPNKFDYNSVMLYGPTAFSKDGRSLTMSPMVSNVRFVPVRQKSKLSREDVVAINLLYKCKKESKANNNILSENRYPSNNLAGQYRPTPYHPYTQFQFPYFFG